MGDKVTYLTPPPGKAHHLARIVSNIVNPVVAGVFIAGLVAYRALNDPVLTFQWFGLTVFLTVVPPLSYIIYLVKTGYLADIFMPDREKRIRPTVVIVAWIALSAIILAAIGAPLAIILILIVTVILIGSLLGITFMWKISFHAAIIATAATISLMQGASQGWLISLLVPLVGWSRVRLGRHTTSQVIAGCIAGSLVSVTMYSALRLYLGM